ncbi:MAG TPA: SurA N-terminal domain-containing protein, partial [Thermodesulfobacteriota bacterium]|nr:SurA N-terminal domain-containing protein [Thermodesulfobacteriota bacterium]
MKKIGLFCLGGLLILFWGTLVQGGVDNRIVAIVNNDIITFYELEKTMKGVAPPNIDTSNRAEMQKQLLLQMIDHKLVDLQVKKLGLQVLAEEVDRTIARIKQEQGLENQEQFAATLAKQGLTEKDLKEKIKEQILRYKLMSREIGSKIIISQERIKDYYQKNKSEFQRMEGIHLAHIILRVDPNGPSEELAQKKQLAQEILDRLKRG